MSDTHFKEKSFYSPIQIGNVCLSGNLFLAPVAGYSDVSFRTICLEEGASFTYTEMVSAEALVRSSKKTHLLMQKSQIEEKYAIQLFGSDSKMMAEATKIVAEEYAPAIVDVNAGCPMQKITKQGAGSALLDSPTLLYNILKEMKNALIPYNIPLTLKIRSGLEVNKPLWKDAARVAIDAGVEAITFHPRSKAQCYSGISNVSLIGELKEYAKDSGIKVFGSGDLFSPEDAHKMFSLTHCDGVMFARGAMGNPFIFRQTIDFLKNGKYKAISLKEKIDMAKKELRLLSLSKGEKVACLEMRKRCTPYIKGVEGAAILREKLVHCSTILEYEEILNSCLL